MLGINRSVDVVAAAKPSATKGSNASCPPASSQRCDGAGWSVKPKPWIPAASVAAATLAMASPLTSSRL
ncbi:hypothetical protein MOKP122_39280 [Mycobacterium avium subsp. hominissuis]